MTKILIVEDEEAMLAGLEDNLEFEGYDIDTAPDGELGLKKIIDNHYDLVLLDVMLPGISGFDILKQARGQGVNIPVILLTAKSEELDKVRGLELGADDYLTKPFSLRELIARIKAILRRTGNVSIASGFDDFVELGRLNVNFENYEATEDGSNVKMSHKEFEILNYLYKNAGHIVTRDDLLDKIWGMDYQPTARTVDNFIVKLRQKINSESSQHILTVHGVGYKLIL